MSTFKYRQLPPEAVTHLVVHHSATKYDHKVTRKDIDLWHRARGWLSIGYHWVIRRDGCIEPGRLSDEQGAHVAGHNDHSLGICMIGGLDQNGDATDNFTEAQYKSLEALLMAYKYDYSNAEIVTHKDIANNSTLCSEVQLAFDF